MKKRTVILLFVFIFAAAYLCLCYLIPGWRIEFAAEGNHLLYFWECIQTGTLKKSITALAIAAAGLCLFLPFCRTQKNMRHEKSKTDTH